jgi:hypothetical protein
MNCEIADNIIEILKLCNCVRCKPENIRTSDRTNILANVTQINHHAFET